MPQRESSKRNESGLLRKPAKVDVSAKGLMASNVHKGPTAASATLRNFSSYGDELTPEEGLSAEALRHRNSPKTFGNPKLDIKKSKTQGTGSTTISGPASFDEKEQLISKTKNFEERKESLDSKNSFSEIPDPTKQARSRIVEITTKKKQELSKLDYELWARDNKMFGAINRSVIQKQSLTEKRQTEHDEKDVEEPINLKDDVISN